VAHATTGAARDDAAMSEPSTSAPGWRLDERTSIGRENLDAAHVARYDEKEDADADAEVQLLLGAGIQPAATVVELGAGTGQFSLAAAEVFDRVVAVDPSPVMLAQLRQKSAGAGASTLEIVESGFLGYEHEGAPPDAVYSRYALHHLPDFWKAVALDRVRRLLAPSGVFRLWDVVYHFPAAEAEQRIEAWCATGSDADGRWSRAELEEHVRDENSTFTWLLEPMLLEAGFTIRAVTYADDGFSAQYLLAPTSGS
jgi:ubiquinone/menaquinone biosynthesis C-methylase UbiE